MTTYTLRIPVTAWRVAEDGSLPEEAREAMDGRVSSLTHRIGERSDEEMAHYHRMQQAVPGWVIPDRHYDYWQWFDPQLTRQQAGAGDWIVYSDYGVQAMSDEEFHACCKEINE